MHEVSLRDTVVDFKYFFFRSFPEWTKKFFVCVYGSFFVPQMPPDKKKAPRSFGLHLFLLDKKRPGVEVDVFFFSAAVLVEFGVR